MFKKWFLSEKQTNKNKNKTKQKPTTKQNKNKTKQNKTNKKPRYRNIWYYVCDNLGAYQWGGGMRTRKSNNARFNIHKTNTGWKVSNKLLQQIYIYSFVY